MSGAVSHDNHIMVMSAAARTAGHQLLDHFRNRDTLLIEYKNPGDLVSIADRQSEETIIAVLTAVFPDYGILGEEGGAKPASAAGYRWVIDPLDGTSNFLHGIPFWCVTIALEQNGTVLAGVTYDPIQNELFYAVKGQGTYLNDQIMSTKQNHSLHSASVSLDVGGSPHITIPSFTKAFAASSEHCATAMCLRSCALTMAYVAVGRLDIAVNFGKVNPWDTNAGWLLVTEAKGVVTDTTGEAVNINTDNVLCVANQNLYDQFIPLLKAA